MSKKVVVGADHGGYPLKDIIVELVKEKGLEVLDVGTFGPEPVDYPDYALKVGHAIREKKADLGILLCGSGVGASIAANKLPGVRAAVCHDTFSAHQGREDDDMNVLCMGARVIGPQLALEIAQTFLAAHFSGLERHQRRLNKVMEIERQYQHS